MKAWLVGPEPEDDEYNMYCELVLADSSAQAILLARSSPSMHAQCEGDLSRLRATWIWVPVGRLRRLAADAKHAMVVRDQELQRVAGMYPPHGEAEACRECLLYEWPDNEESEVCPDCGCCQECGCLDDCGGWEEPDTYEEDDEPVVPTAINGVPLPKA